MDLTVLPAHPAFIRYRNEPYLPFAFPAEAGTHLPTPEGWKAELALGGWLVTYCTSQPVSFDSPRLVTVLLYELSSTSDPQNLFTAMPSYMVNILPSFIQISPFSEEISHHAE